MIIASRMGWIVVFTMDVIEHNKELRTLFSNMVNDLLDKYKLNSESNEEYTIRKTIFS